LVAINVVHLEKAIWGSLVLMGEPTAYLKRVFISPAQPPIAVFAQDTGVIHAVLRWMDFIE
jgi:hypothetical protein